GDFGRNRRERRPRYPLEGGPRLGQLVIGGGPARPRKALLLALRDDVDGVVDLVGLADRGRTLDGHETDQGSVVAAAPASDATRQLRPDVRAQVEIAQRRDGDQAV